MKGFCVLLHLNTLFMNQGCRRKQSEHSSLNKQCHEPRVLKNTNRLYLIEYSQTTSAIAKCTVVDVVVRVVIVVVIVIVIAVIFMSLSFSMALLLLFLLLLLYVCHLFYTLVLM